jgi:O-antigen/teichoic acid export membrane protein
MSETVDKSLQRIAKGTGLVFIGTIVGMFFGFTGNVIIVRYLTTTEYGLFSLALTVVSVLINLSDIGLIEGTPRYIAYFAGKEENKRISGVITSAIQIVLIVSLLCSVLIVVLAGWISGLLKNDDLSTILKILSLTIVFTNLANILVNIFRGFGIAKVKVYFINIITPAVRILFFAAAVVLGLSLAGVVYAYVSAIIIATVLLCAYSMRNMPFSSERIGRQMEINREKNDIENEIDIKIKKEIKRDSLLTRELVYFSLPLFGQDVLMLVIVSTDKLMLGYFKTPEAVGMYNVSFSFANLIPLTLASLIFIYLPIASQLYAKGLFNELSRTYVVVTKWVFSASLPVFLVLFLFPNTVLNIVYGPRYVQAGAALQILALGFFAHCFLGPNAGTLIAMGRTRLTLMNTLVRTFMNVGLNFLLIPSMGIVGAAVASAVSLFVGNVLASAELYLISRIHPLTKTYVKPVLISVVLIPAFSIGARNILGTLSITALVLLWFLFLTVYGASILVTRSFDQEDIMLLLSIEKRLGIDAKPLKKILKRFL